MMNPVEAIEFSLKFRIFDNALLLCQEYFAREPTAELLALYVRSYLGQGSPNQASVLCEQHMSIVEKSKELHVLYAQALFEHGKYTEAEHILDKAEGETIKAPAEVETALMYLKALIKQRTNRQEEAEKEFTEIAKQQPFMLSAVKLSETSPPPKKERKKSMTTPVRASRIPKSKTTQSPDTTSSTHPYTSAIMKNATNPLETLQTMPVAMKNSIQALKAEAYYYFRCSKYPEAEATFQRLYNLNPHTVEGMDIYSTVLWQLKDQNALTMLAHRAVELAPSRPEPWIATGNLLSMQHNTEGAIQMFQRAASIDRSCSYALALAGHEYLLFDSLKDAAILFRQSIGRNKNEWSAWYGLGSVYFRQDNFKTSEYYMKKALEINPDSSVLYYVYSMVLRKCSNIDKALEMLDKALEIDPMNLVVAFQKAILFYDKGMISDATIWLEKADRLMPHEPTIAYMRGKIAQRIGNVKEAVVHFTDALIYGHHNGKEIRAQLEVLNDKIIKEILGEKAL